MFVTCDYELTVLRLRAKMIINIVVSTLWISWIIIIFFYIRFTFLDHKMTVKVFHLRLCKQARSTLGPVYTMLSGENASFVWNVCIH